MVLLNLFIISLVVVFVIDLSGVIQSIEGGLSKLLGFRVAIPKPFSCSLCLTFWTGLAYLICTSNLNLTYLAALCLVSFLTRNTAGFLRWIQETLIRIEDILYKLIR